MSQSVKEALADAETLRRHGWSDALMKAGMLGSRIRAEIPRTIAFRAYEEDLAQLVRLAAHAAFRAVPALREVQ